MTFKKEVNDLAQVDLISNQPSKRRMAMVDLAIQQGRTADWILERFNGMEVRKEFTDALKEATDYVDTKGNKSSFLSAKLKDGQTPTGKFIEAETNYLYGKLGISREARKAMKKRNKRDYFDAAQLHAVGLAEQHMAKIWKTCVKNQWTRDKAKQARTEMLNRLASVQQWMQELTGEAA